MTPHETKGLAKWIAKLFAGQVTAEQAKLLRDELTPFRSDAAKDAIKQHRTTHDFLSIPQLLEGCRAAERGSSAAPTVATNREGSRADVYRRQRPDLRDAGDLEVILRVVRGWWYGCKRRDSYRAGFEVSLRNDDAFRALQPEHQDAWVSYVFDATPQDFDDALADLRTHGAALPEPAHV